MKKLFAVPLACVVLAAGCASSAQMRHVEDKETASQRTLRETDQRLRTLEQSVATLDSQMAQLKNRTFEVRTRGGQKTSMTVVPILPPAPLPVPSVAGTSAAGQNGAGTAEASSASPHQREVALGQNGPSVISAPASGTGTPVAPMPSPVPAAKESQPAAAAPADKGSQSVTPASAPAGSPKGRVIDPATQPTSFPPATPATAPQAAATPPVPASSLAGRTVTAGPNGQVGAPGKSIAPVSGTGAVSVGLPPVAAPEPAVPPAVNPANFAAQNANQPVVPASSGKGDPAGGNTAVPIPALPPSALALPPEHPGLPPVEAASPAVVPLAPASQATSQPVTPAEVKPSAAVNAAAPTNLPPQQAGKPTKNEKAAYEAALKVMTAGRSAEGITRFETFLQEYPHGGYAANAEYWIGEGLYAQGKYQDALNQFRKVDASYPQHHKNADALLKTGMSLSRLGDKDAATQAYKQLLTRFPNSEAARIARSRGLAR
ncbi:MAG: tol-pal system protein YbgF [Desulfovibrio sp.]|uniref:tol-pal system protein YbgF n=1 Tax=Desulfovibrio sp. TaxID=885 RepID=UPI0039E3D0B4